LNQWLKDLLISASVPRVSGKQLRIKYITQVKARPPTFALFSNRSDIPGYYSRYLRSNLQKDMKLEGVPIRFIIRKTEGKEVEKNLLKHGKQSRRSVGNKSSRVVGPKRDNPNVMRIHKEKRDARRRRDTRLSHSRTPKSNSKY
jgi:hypothetical protein